MKLASLGGGRDGKLIVVSRDLSRYVHAADVAPTLQAAMDQWSVCVPGLQALSDKLNAGMEGQPFDETECCSPLPRAYQWADGSAYVNHVELVRRARGATVPESFWNDPLMYQGGSDAFLAPHENIAGTDAAWGVDFEAEVAVITGDVPMGIDASDAGACIRLIMLVNDVSLRNLIPAELKKGFGFFNGKPSSAFSPVAVTPDELGPAWRENKVHLPLLSYLNGELFGKPNAGVDMTFDFAQLIGHAARTRRLTAGTIVGSGTVSNRLEDGPGKPITEGGAGYSCIAEMRMIEIIRNGSATTPFLGSGDRVQIEMRNTNGDSIFACIDQTVC